MESKKINQLATELTPALSDLTIIGDPTTGISKKITLSQMASLFTGTVEEYANLAAFPLVGTADTIYIALDTNVLYRWDTTLTSYVELSPNIVTSLVFSDANGFDGNISLVGSVATLTITTALTQGSVAFIGASGALSQDNANYFWDNTNKRLGINTNTPTTAIDAFGSGIIGRLNGTSTNNAFLGFASAGTNKWSIGNVQSDHRFRIYSEANTSELVSVLQTGEFGIGIANPTTKLHIDGGASALIANLDANTSVAKSISFRSDNSARFNIEVSGTESGSNAGADFFIRRYSDAGALIDTPLTITRSTGAITLTGALNGTDISLTSSNYDILKWQKTSGTASNIYSLSADSSGAYIQDVTNTKTLLYLAENTGNATFIGNITSLAASGTATIIAEGSATSGEGLVSVRGKNSSGTSRRADFKYDNADVIRIATASPINMQFETNDVTRLTLNGSTGAATFSGNVSLAKTTPTLTLDGRSSGNSGAVINILGWNSSNKNWQISTGTTASAGLLFIPSSAAGGSSFSTPIISFSESGGATFANTLISSNDVTGAAIKLSGFTNYGTIQDANNVRRIWFENTGSYRTIFDLPASGTSFDWRKNDGTPVFLINNINSRNAQIDTNGNVLQSFLAQPGNVANGGTCSITIQQVQYEWMSSYLFDIVGLYAPSGTNVRAFSCGWVHFLADGSTHDNNIAPATQTGWSASSSSTSSGSFTITFTNNSGYTQNNINIRVLKLNRMN